MSFLSIDELVRHILCANSQELHLILDAVTERFSELYPDRELMTIAVPGSDPAGQIAQLQNAARLLSSAKNDLP